MRDEVAVAIAGWKGLVNDSQKKEERSGTATMDFSSHLYTEKPEKKKPRPNLRQFLKQKRQSASPAPRSSGGSNNPVILVPQKGSPFKNEPKPVEEPGITSPMIFSTPPQSKVKPSPKPELFSDDMIKIPKSRAPVQSDTDSESSEEDDIMSVSAFPDESPAPYTPKSLFPGASQSNFVPYQTPYSPIPVSTPNSLKYLAPPAVLNISPAPKSPVTVVYTPMKGSHPMKSRNTPSSANSENVLEDIHQIKDQPKDLCHKQISMVDSIASKPSAIITAPVKAKSKLVKKSTKVEPEVTEDSVDGVSASMLMKMLQEQQQQIKSLANQVKVLVDDRNTVSPNPSVQSRVEPIFSDDITMEMDISNTENIGEIVDHTEGPIDEKVEEEDDIFLNRVGIPENEWLDILQSLFEQTCEVKTVFPYVLEEGTLNQCIQLMENSYELLETLQLDVFHKVFDFINYLVDNDIRSGKWRSMKIYWKSISNDYSILDVTRMWIGELFKVYTPLKQDHRQSILTFISKSSGVV